VSIFKSSRLLQPASGTIQLGALKTLTEVYAIVNFCAVAGVVALLANTTATPTWTLWSISIVANGSLSSLLSQMRSLHAGGHRQKLSPEDN